MAGFEFRNLPLILVKVKVMNKKQFVSRSDTDTETIGAALASELIKTRPNELYFVMLKGSLGAGKTAFTRGFASVLSPKSKVKSPSFTVVNEYRSSNIPLYHFDLYRLGEECDLSEIGFSEYSENGHCIIEWSEYLNEPESDGFIEVEIEKTGENERCITVTYS